MPDTTIEVTPAVCQVIRNCRNHVFEVRAAWGPTISGLVAESLVQSLDAVFGLAHNGGKITHAGDKGLGVLTSFMYAEMVPFRMSAERIAKELPFEHSVDEIAKTLESFVTPVEWSVHS
jgi:hypothetical protein